MQFIELIIHSKGANRGYSAEIDSQNLTSQWIHLQTRKEEGII
jgi:hypothetical protein